MMMICYNLTTHYTYVQHIYIDLFLVCFAFAAFLFSIFNVFSHKSNKAKLKLKNINNFNSGILRMSEGDE